MCIIATRIIVARDDRQVWKVLVKTNGKYYPLFRAPAGDTVYYTVAIPGGKTINEGLLPKPIELDHFVVPLNVGSKGDERGGYSCFGNREALKDYLAWLARGQMDTDDSYIPLNQSKALTVIPFVIPRGSEYAVGRIGKEYLGADLVAIRASVLVYEGEN